MKKFLVFFTLLYLSFQVFSFGKSEPINKDRPIIATSFNAIKELVSTVGGDKITVLSLVPDNVDAHNYELRRKDLENLNNADLLFINGLEMEEWIEDLVENKIISNSKLITLSDGLNLIHIGEDEHCECGHHHAHQHEHHEAYDPHVFLGLSEIADMAKSVAKSLSKLDPKNEAYYTKNAETFASDILAIRNEYREKIAKKHQKQIVVAHKAFAYLCRDLGLEQLGIRDTFNKGEASAKAISQIVDFCKEKNISVIFVEELSKQEVFETLAKETHSKIETLYTLEQAGDDLSILERQKSNLEKIYNSLK